jgi:hypothetical protein
LKALDIEFVAKRPASPWLLGALTFAFCLMALWEGWQAWLLRPQVLAAESEMSKLTIQLDRALQAKRDAASAAAIEPAYARDAQAVAKLAAFPLARVLASLEGARVQGVRLSALDISAAENAASAELEFSDHDALMRYLEEINAGEERPRWRLAQAQTANTGSGMNTATIRSTWDAAP